MGYMLLQGSGLDASELRYNSNVENFASGSSGTELSEYWPTYMDGTDLWLEGDQGQLDLNPDTGTRQTSAPPSSVSDPLEIALDANGLIAPWLPVRRQQHRRQSGPQSGRQSKQSGHTGRHQDTDAITAAKPARTRVKVGRAVVLDVDLDASSVISVRVLRYVPASGHGKRRRKAHYALVGAITEAGVRGTNAIKLTRVAGHTLKRGSYEAEISAGGKTRTVRFALID